MYDYHEQLNDITVLGIQLNMTSVSGGLQNAFQIRPVMRMAIMKQLLTLRLELFLR